MQLRNWLSNLNYNKHNIYIILRVMDKNSQLSFLNCYICFDTLKKPKMCPTCSKVACQKCLRTWIEQKRPQCPHCRKASTLSNFAQCERFISDVKHLIQQIDKKQNIKAKCPEHKIQMSYYCDECKVPICSDCGMFGVKHRGHKITHLKKIYQDYKNAILNQIVKFDEKIESFRKNGFIIKFQMQKIIMQMAQRKGFIQEYFLAILERLQQQFKQKQQKITEKFDENLKQIQFLQNFRDNIYKELQLSTQNELITKSSQLINYCESVYNKVPQVQQIEHNFDTIHEIVPKYSQFKYKLRNYSILGDGIVYSDVYLFNGFEWRLKIYPRGNGLAKDTHLSVFLQLTKGTTNGNKYQYKIQLTNKKSTKDSIIREYSSNFDVGQCWGYNQFVSIEDIRSQFLVDGGDLDFIVGVRNPSYKSLVRDQKQYIIYLQEKLKRIKSSSQDQNANPLIKKISKLSNKYAQIQQKYKQKQHDKELHKRIQKQEKQKSPKKLSRLQQLLMHSDGEGQQQQPEQQIAKIQGMIVSNSNRSHYEINQRNKRNSLSNPVYKELNSMRDSRKSSKSKIVRNKGKKPQLRQQSELNDSIILRLDSQNDP